MVIRTDDIRYGDAYLNAVQDVGIRYFLAVGPRRPPFPRTFTEWNGNSSRDIPVTFERQLEVSEALIKKWHNAANGRLKLAVVAPTIDPSANGFNRAELPEIKRQALATRALSKKYGLIFGCVSSCMRKNTNDRKCVSCKSCFNKKPGRKF